jgi:amino acid transporter
MTSLKTHTRSLTPQAFAETLRTTGWIIFGIQISLGLISGAILVFALGDPNFNLKANDLMSSSGLLFAFGGLISLMVGVYWAFRYTRLAAELSSFHEEIHPKKSAVIQLLEQGLTINAVGIILTLLGVEAVVGVLVAKSLTEGAGLAMYNASQLIEPLDMLVIQANINTILAQFIGIILAFRLTNRLSHH